jgi:chemotaxis protein methyltransferase CheR
MLTTHLSPSDRAALSLSYGDYLRFCRMMEDRFGLTFPEKRRMELEIGVRRAFAASTCADLNNYYDMLSDPVNGALELERLVNNLTVGETHFFRDAGQFDALANTVLPEIIERRRSIRTLRIWSAGCASGEEPYSIAILLRDLLPDIASWTITILGTDINTQHIERARRGVYGEWAFRENRAKLLRPRFFTQHGNQYELSADVRRMVTFNQINLAEDRYPSYETNTMFMDLILCRNVTIYFPEAVTRTVVDRFYNSLVDGGWLVIGHSEHSMSVYQRFTPRNFPDAILYRRSGEIQKAESQVTSFQNSPPTRSVLTTLSIRPKDTAPLTDPGDTPAAGQKVLADPTRTKSMVGSAVPSSVSPLDSGNEFEQAQALMTYGRIDEARDLLLRWLTNHPNHAQACALLGTAFADMGNWPEAERWCQMAIGLDRLNLDGYYTLALIFQHQGKSEKAIEMMKKVVYIDRNDILGHFSLANLYHTSAQVPLALKFLDNARRILDTRSPSDLVPRSSDITIGRLVETVIKMQQIWEKESTGLKDQGNVKDQPGVKPQPRPNRPG